MVTTTPEGKRYVLVTLTLSCPVCGTIEMQLPGHHLRRVVELLRNEMLAHADLTTPVRAEEEIGELQQVMESMRKETRH